MGRYARAMAAPASPQGPAGRGAGYRPLPGPARTWKVRRWAAIRGPRHKPSAPREPACQGERAILAAPLASRGGEAATVGRYLRATPRAIRTDRASSRGGGLCRPRPWPVSDLTPRHQIRRVGAATRPVCSGPGWAGLSQGGKVPATGAGPAVVKDTLTTRGRQRLAANPAMVPCSVQIQAAATEQQQDEQQGPANAAPR